MFTIFLEIVSDRGQVEGDGSRLWFTQGHRGAGGVYAARGLMVEMECETVGGVLGN